MKGLMKQELAPRDNQIDDSFAQIIEKEYGSRSLQQSIGAGVIHRTVPFGEQFMSPLPEVAANPAATTPGGLTATTDRGTASLDDSSSSDVA